MPILVKSDDVRSGRKAKARHGRFVTAGYGRHWSQWVKEKEKGPAPRCRACRRTQIEDELTVNVTGLYVSYEQNFVTETMLYFCPKQQCINNVPYWTNLKSPDGIRADKSISDVTIAALKDNGLPL